MKLLKTAICLLAFLALLSCEKKESSNNKNGEFVLSFKELGSSLKSAVIENDPAFITVSVQDLAGKNIFSLEKIELIKFNNEFISKPLEMAEGDYKLTAFLVLDKSGNAIYAAPLKDSEKAYLVNNPLPLDFSITIDEVTKLSPEVLSTENQTASSFGYLTASFTVVNTFNFYTSVFEYNSTSMNFELTSAQLEISNEEINYQFSLSAKTNQITVEDGYANYKLVFKKDGYTSQTFNLTSEELKKCFNSPLKVLFLTPTSIELQPGTELKDAVAGLIIPDANRGDGPFGALYSWTQEGILNTTRTFIEFDLSMIAKTQTISHAKLYLTFYNVEGYATSGETSFYVKKITSEWDEMLITWNSMPATTEMGKLSFSSIPESTNVLEIDVTSLIQDQIANPENNHGLCLMLQEESAYRRFCWYSSDATVSTQRPKLIINY